MIDARNEFYEDEKDNDKESIIRVKEPVVPEVKES